jgi:hypothetical protein
MAEEIQLPGRSCPPGRRFLRPDYITPRQSAMIGAVEALRWLLPREKPGMCREIRREWRPGARRVRAEVVGRFTEFPLLDLATCPSAP